MTSLHDSARNLSRKISLPSEAAAAAPTYDYQDMPLEVISEASGEKKEKCGLFGIAGPAEAVERCYYGLYALQHRGQESAGIAASDGSASTATPAWAWWRMFFAKIFCKELTGNAGDRPCALFHDRVEQVQRPAAAAKSTSAARWRWRTTETSSTPPSSSTSTSSTATFSNPRPTPKSSSTCWPSRRTRRSPTRWPHVLRHLQGRFRCCSCFPDRIEGCRDPWGIRPLVDRADAGGPLLRRQRDMRV